jgi:hypothetical protein
MKSVTVAVSIDRAEAIRAGKKQYGHTTVLIDPANLNDDQRDELALTGQDNDGNAWLQYADSAMNGVGYTTPIVEPTEAIVAKALDEKRARRLAYEAKEKAEKEKRAREQREEAIRRANEFLGESINKIISSVNVHRTEEIGGWALYYKEHLPADLLQMVKAHIEEANAEHKRRKVDWDARKKAMDEEAARKERDKAAALNSWLNDNGTATQRQRRQAGLMPDEQVLAMVRDQLFAEFKHLARYERMTADDFENYHAEDIEYETSGVTEATDDEFRALQAITEIAKNVSDEAEVKLRDHIASVRNKELERRRSVLVTIPWKGHKLSREYQL